MERRDFLKATPFILTGLAAGCATAGKELKATITPTIVTPTETTTPTPTEAPTATATEVPIPTETLEPIHIIASEADLANADTVLDGQTAEYAKRVLAAYQRGEIKNFDPSIAPAAIQDPYDTNYFFNDIYFYGKYGEGPYIELYRNDANADLSKRPVKDVTVTKDGEGGLRYLQLWLQKDGTPGLVWYHASKEEVKTWANFYTNRIFEVIASTGKYPTMLLPIKYKDAPSCVRGFGLADIMKKPCQAYMEPELTSKRDAAIQKWLKTGSIPSEIQNGEIEFMLMGTTL